MTMGDYAWGMSLGQSEEIKTLRKRLKRLENTVSDLLTVLADDGTIEVTDPDKKGHLADKEVD